MEPSVATFFDAENGLPPSTRLLPIWWNQPSHAFMTASRSSSVSGMPPPAHSKRYFAIRASLRMARPAPDHLHSETKTGPRFRHLTEADLRRRFGQTLDRAL